MKYLIPIMILVALVLALSACGGDPVYEPDPGQVCTSHGGAANASVNEYGNIAAVTCKDGTLYGIHVVYR